MTPRNIPKVFLPVSIFPVHFLYRNQVIYYKTTVYTIVYG